jgi:hypothetical protein
VAATGLLAWRALRQRLESLHKAPADGCLLALRHASMDLLAITLIFTLSTGLGAIGARVMLETVFFVMMRLAARRSAGATARWKDAPFALQAPAV